MTVARAAHVVALLSATLIVQTARAQTPTVEGDYPPALRSAIESYRSGDPAAAEKALRTLPGNPDAEAWLAVLMIDRGQERDALRALQHASAAGSAEADHRLGVAYAQGRLGLVRDDARAAQLIEKAASTGLRRAQTNLGLLYMRGQGVQRDLVQARAWLEKGAAGGNPDALYALGRAMEDSEGQAGPDPVRAASLYRRAAEKGHALAALRYGLALADGSGVKRDPAEAQRLLLQAQGSGVPEAALALGDLVARTPATRDKAANEKIVEAAISWYRYAADAGVPSAQFKLANAYFAGAGVARDPAQALRWYARAAQQGLPEAEHALGIMTMGGVAGPADPVEGYKWLILADQGGHPDSRAVREKASEQISARDRQKAEALAKAFVPTLERPIADTAPTLAPAAAPSPAPAKP